MLGKHLLWKGTLTFATSLVGQNFDSSPLLLHDRFATGRFSGIRRPTVGADFLSKKLMLQDSEVFVQVWDTAGQERFCTGSVGASYFRGAHGALLVYDVSNEKSIEQIEMWRDECLSRQDRGEFFPIVVIGNKTDLRDALPENERLDQSSILQWCRENQYGHVETCAKDGHGVEAAMIAIVALALENQKQYIQAHGPSGTNGPSAGSSGNGRGKTVELSKKYEKQSSGCGCS